MFERPISDQIVVVTGASSGIGREVTIQLVERGATVVAVARGRERLQQLAASLARARGRVEIAPADVSQWEHVRDVAEATVRRFGRIDTWINNAAVALFATAADARVEEIDRVLAVNLHGQIYGMKAALPVMRAQGGGTIINVGSALSGRAAPLQSAYSASKHGIQGFAEALRMELDFERSGVDVTMILPSSINTPLFGHARSKLGVMPKPIPPVYDPKVVADAIRFAVERPRRDIVVGGAAKAFLTLAKLSPAVLDVVMIYRGRYFRKQMSDRPDDGQDNLFAPVAGPGRSRGEFGENVLGSSPYTRIFESFPALRSAVAATVLPWLLGPALVALSGFDLGLRGIRALKRGLS